MSDKEAQRRGSEALWRDLVSGAIDKGWVPLAVVGMVQKRGKYIACLAKGHILPRAALIEVLRQIVSELEREEQGDAQPRQ